MKETTFGKMNRSEFLNLMDNEANYNLGIKPSGDISGTSSVIYEGNEIKPDEVLHFSINQGNDLDSKRVDNTIRRLTEDYKESSWAKAKHVVFQTSKSNEGKYRQKSLFEKVKSYIIIRRLTIPMTHTDNWNRDIDSWTPVLSSLFFLYTTELLNIYDPIQILCLSTMFSLSIVIRFNTYHSEAPGFPFSLCFILLSFVMSIMWIWMLANIVVDLISIYGHIFNISSTFLGVSFLALGNCVGDAIASLSLARKGYGGMAMMGCFACPLFNFLIGLSLSSMRLILFDDSEGENFGTILTKGVELDLLDQKATVLLAAVCTTIIVLVSFLIGVPKNAFKFSTRQAYGRVGIYVAFLGLL